MSDRLQATFAESDAPPDDLSRDVYCILGLPVDAIEMHTALHRIQLAATGKTPFFVSTPNLNFLVNSQSDSEFRNTLLQSDLSLADGMPIIWIARIFGIPIKSRISGSDVFDALKSNRHFVTPLKVFLFGGSKGVAEEACRTLNVRPSGLHCVGSYYPGFGTVDDMSRDDIIDKVNSSGADFLVAALGAKKGQLWLWQNHHRLRAPVRAHLGASINFQAGTVRRAPTVMQKMGLEWLWRIKEEPYLWRRYINDGMALLRLLLTRIFPLAVCAWWLQLKYAHRGRTLVVTQTFSRECITVKLSGPATAKNVYKVIPVFRAAVESRKKIMINYSDTCSIDARFLGLLLMLTKRLDGSSARLIFIGLSAELQRIFRLNNLNSLLSFASSD